VLALDLVQVEEGCPGLTRKEAQVEGGVLG